MQGSQAADEGIHFPLKTEFDCVASAFAGFLEDQFLSYSKPHITLHSVHQRFDIFDWHTRIQSVNHHETAGL